MHIRSGPLRTFINCRRLRAVEFVPRLGVQHTEGWRLSACMEAQLRVDMALRGAGVVLNWGPITQPLDEWGL